MSSTCSERMRKDLWMDFTNLWGIPLSQDSVFLNIPKTGNWRALLANSISEVDKSNAVASVSPPAKFSKSFSQLHQTEIVLQMVWSCLSQPRRKTVKSRRVLIAFNYFNWRLISWKSMNSLDMRPSSAEHELRPQLTHLHLVNHSLS